MVLQIILVSNACDNKLPQPQWLQTTQMYLLTVLEVRSLTRLRQSQQGSFPSRSAKESFVSLFFQLLGVSCIPWLMASSAIFKISHMASSDIYDSDHPAFLLQEPCSDFTGPTQVTQENLFVSSSLTTPAKALLPCNLMQFQN